MTTKVPKFTQYGRNKQIALNLIITVEIVWPYHSEILKELYHQSENCLAIVQELTMQC